MLATLFHVIFMVLSIVIGAFLIGAVIYAIPYPMEYNSVKDVLKLTGAYILCAMTVMLGFGFTMIGVILLWETMKWFVLGYNCTYDPDSQTQDIDIAM